LNWILSSDQDLSEAELTVPLHSRVRTHTFTNKDRKVCHGEEEWTSGRSRRKVEEKSMTNVMQASLPSQLCQDQSIAQSDRHDLTLGGEQEGENLIKSQDNKSLGGCPRDGKPW